MYERFLNKDVNVFLKFPMQTQAGDLTFPAVQGKLVANDTEGLCLEVKGLEKIIPHTSIQHVDVVSHIARAVPAIQLPTNIRGTP